MHIGRRPVGAFGNADGDRQMLQWTAAGSGVRFCSMSTTRTPTIGGPTIGKSSPSDDSTKGSTRGVGHPSGPALCSGGKSRDTLVVRAVPGRSGRGGGGGAENGGSALHDDDRRRAADGGGYRDPGAVRSESGGI